MKNDPQNPGFFHEISKVAVNKPPPLRFSFFPESPRSKGGGFYSPPLLKFREKILDFGGHFSKFSGAYGAIFVIFFGACGAVSDFFLGALAGSFWGGLNRFLLVGLLEAGAGLG